ncbi:MAG: 30S ribosomal protein S18 [bacterium]|nr:30S ribosomal protein S18 [bacterium]
MAFKRRTGESRGPSRRPTKPAQQHCFFCVHHVAEPDYKDTQLLGRFVSSYKKIAPRRRSGVCSKHQRRLATAIKRARQMALMPYIPEQR